MKKQGGFANSIHMFAAKAMVGALSRRQSEPAVSNRNPRVDFIVRVVAHPLDTSRLTLTSSAARENE
jgi:hypothetical protein